MRKGAVLVDEDGELTRDEAGIETLVRLCDTMCFDKGLPVTPKEESS